MGCTKCGTNNGLTREQRSLLAVLVAAAAPAASKDIAAWSGLEGTVVSCGLKSLKAKGYVESPSRCRYAVTATGKAALGA